MTNNVEYDKHIFEDLKPNEVVLSPGMKYKHYAPNTKCILVYSKENDKMIAKINKFVKEDIKSLVICSNENVDKYKAQIVLNYGSIKKKEEIASNIFTLLRKVDILDVDTVYIEGIEKEGIGIAIMNRLIRACSHNYIEID